MDYSEILNYPLFKIKTHEVTVFTLALPVFLLLLAAFINFITVRFLLRPHLRRLKFSDRERKDVRGMLRGFLYNISLWFSVNILFPNTETDVLEQPDRIKILGILEIIFAAFAIYYGFQFVIWLLNNVFLKRYFLRKEIDLGRQYTITRFIVYIGSIIGFLTILRTMGVDPSWIIGSGAALLVGIGLGLQQTFNDLISGIIILVEGTVEVGDIVKVDGMVAKMRKIGLRVSEVETRDSSVLLIPNSKLVVDNVNNWSHYNKPTRFQVNVGVSYTSDVRLVEKLLLQAADEHSKVLDKPAPRVQFIDFGSSSLDFTLHFFAVERMAIEFIKSDLRFNIISMFREHNVEIPFPQRDLWLRNPQDLRRPREKRREKPVIENEKDRETDLDDVKKDMPSENPDDKPGIKDRNKKNP